MTHPVVRRISELNPRVDFWSARVVDNISEELCVRQNVLEPIKHSSDQGVMVTVFDKGGYGYAATPDTSASALAEAFKKATEWARLTSRHAIFDVHKNPAIPYQDSYRSVVKKPWDSMNLSERIGLLKKACELLKGDPRIVDWEASLWYCASKQTYLTSHGGVLEQDFHFFVPHMSATAHHGDVTQTRTLHGRGYCRQSGLEALDEFDWQGSAENIAREAIELLLAENCPSEKMDLLLAPDQMLLQIHESIGHPLELDRILGDERNYAGTSFVTLDMFGKYQYGSPLLNITFDPSLQQEFASFAYDDDGTKAQKKYLIKDGILTLPLGGATSQIRSGLEGVANSRACNWNRPPIDRMANLNLEAGESSFDDMVQSVERGILMKSNVSWSIDDSRNKFQFGCEWGQLIEQGKLTHVVRSPNYRGISATFWRSLKMLGNKSTFEMYGSPFCGKGEPNQCIRVGHASPACLFGQVDVFGGAQ